MTKLIALILAASLAFPACAKANGESVSPNMSLIIPAVGITVGPQWAADEVMSFGIIDAHDHSPGHGVPVTPAGLDINSTLSCQGNSVTNVKNTQFTAQSGPPANGSIYESGVDLYYVDGNGNNVRLTQSGSIVGTSGSISGLTSPASASYNSGSSTFVWQSATNTSANLDASCLLQRDLVAASNAITLCAPAALASNYSLTWPGSLPGSTLFMTLDSSGNIGTASSIQPTQIAAHTITQNQLAPRGTGSTVGVGGVAVSPSCGVGVNSSSTSFSDVTNLSVTITTTGRPIFVGLMDDGSGNGSWIGGSCSSAFCGGSAYFRFLNNGTQIALTNPTCYANNQGCTIEVPASSFYAIDFQSAGTYTYKLQQAKHTGTDATEIQYVVLVAYEL